MSWCDRPSGDWNGVAGAGPKGSPGARSPGFRVAPTPATQPSSWIGWHHGCHWLRQCFAALLGVIAVTSLAAAAEPQRLTTDGVRKLSPVFADGGDSILFSMHREPTRVALFRFQISDGATDLVDASLTEHQFDADISADGRYLCFVLTANSPQSVLVIRDRVEQQEARYAPREARGTVRSPKLDLRHNRVVFTVSDPGGQQIASVDLHGQNFKLLTQTTGINGWPAVSPDGEQIAFTSSRDGTLQVYVMSAAAENIHPLTDGPQRNMRPAWSPDGTQLAYSSSIDGDLEICVMQADGSNVRRITQHVGRDDFPVWQPDGRRVLFVSERDGDCDLYLSDVDPLP